LGFLGFLGFLKKPKKPRFFKTQFYSPGNTTNVMQLSHLTIAPLEKAVDVSHAAVPSLIDKNYIPTVR